MQNNKLNLRTNLKIFILLIVAIFILFPLSGVLLFIIEMEDNVIVKGTISPEEQYTVVSHIDGRLTKLRIRNGQKVSKGEVLAVVDSSEYENNIITTEAEIHLLEAELASAELALKNKEAEPLPAELLHAKTNLEECRKKEAKVKDKLERYSGLHEEQAVARMDLENIELEYIAIKADLSRAEENYQRIENGLAERNISEARMAVQLAKAKLESKKAILPIYRRKIEDCKLLSPADGIVLSIPCRDSMYVTSGEPAIEIAGGTETMIWAYVEEAFIRKVKPGQEALVRSEEYSHLQYGNFEAEVIKIADTPISSADGIARYPVKLRLDTDQFDIKYGSNVMVTIVTGNFPAIYVLLNITEEDDIIQRRIERLKKRAQARKERALQRLETDESVSK